MPMDLQDAPPHLLVVCVRNSLDPDPVRLRQEAKRGHGGGGGAIGGEIALHPPPQVFFNTARHEWRQISGIWKELEDKRFD